MSVKKIHLFPSEESYVTNSGSVEADDLALVPLNLSFNNLSDKPVSYVTEAYSLGTHGYRIWSDGFIEQWGKVTTPGQDATKTITFEKPFKKANYNIQTAGWKLSNRHACVMSKTATSVTFKAWDNDNDWYAFGY